MKSLIQQLLQLGLKRQLVPSDLRAGVLSVPLPFLKMIGKSCLNSLVIFLSHIYLREGSDMPVRRA